MEGPAGASVTIPDATAEFGFQPEQRQRTLSNNEAALRVFIDDLYRRSVLVSAAERLKLSAAEQYRLERARLETLVGIIVDRVANDMLEAAPSFTEVAEELYLTNQDRFRRPAERRLRHILLSSQASGESIEDLKTEAQGLLEQLQSGASFSELAKAHSDDPGSAVNGGELGWGAKDKYVPPFAEAAFALSEPGDLSGIVETRFGLHIIELVDLREESVLPFEDVQGQLERRARADWLKAELQAWKADLTDPAKATVDHERLDAFIQSMLEQPDAQPAAAD